MTWRMDFQLQNADLQNIQTLLKVLPKKLRNGAMRKAGREAGAICRRVIQPLVPRSDNEDYSYAHLRDNIISVVRTYNNTVFMACGPRTKKRLYHAHLVEFGTRPRQTGHTSKYKEVGTKRVKTRINGKVAYRTKRIRKSIGSFLDERKALKNGVANRGVMPAFHYMSRGWKQAEPGVVATIEHELRKALATSGVTV